MAGEAWPPTSLELLRLELAKLASEREALQGERRVFRRLGGFSCDRIDVLLRRVDARREVCEQALKKIQKQQRAAETGFSPLGHRLETPPLR